MGFLVSAVREGDLERVVTTLAEDPKATSERDESGVSALLLAIYMGREDIAQAIVENVEELDIFEAAAFGDLPAVERALLGDPGLVRELSPDGFTALHLAAFFGNEEIVRKLLGAGADPSTVSANEMGVTPLNSAAASSQAVIAEALIEAGSPIDAAQHGGWTPLHSAAQNGNLALVVLLLDKGADPQARNAEGRRPVDLAQDRDHDSIAQLLARF
ncbi:MAG: uncharacterized protein QOF16_1614 [Actinomycetota bacterium]|jgi:ankyrin repeat protein|nr:uncharacterized protein [Actinomycetota bacterium]MEA2487960.1 uncharacterized protein [Actinomycetota bacterium]